MFAAAAVCPHPPLLVPEVAAGAAGELEPLRDACDAAVGALVAARPDRLVVVGTGAASAVFGPAAGGTLREYGIDVRAGGAELVLPLSLTIGAWLLDRADTDALAPRTYVAVGSATPPQDCAELGGRLVDGSDRVGLLVMGDGSARRTDTSPGRFDLAAIAYDATVLAALGAGDGASRKLLAGLDPCEATRLLVSGRIAWQVLAAAARAVDVVADVGYADAPYGVGYVVATWRSRVQPVEIQGAGG